MEAPYNIQNHRREQCVRCPTPCAEQLNADFRREGDNACPIGKWMAYKTFAKAPMKGAGDLVARFAEPVAGVMDKYLGTKRKGCAACAKRKEMLNHLIPFGQKPESEYKL